MAGRTSSGRQWPGKVYKSLQHGDRGRRATPTLEWERRTLTLLGMTGSVTGQSSHLWGQWAGGGAERAVGGLALLTLRPALWPPGPPGDSATFQGSWGLRWEGWAMEAGHSVLGGRMEHGPLWAARGGLGMGGRLSLLKSFWNHI